ncbi:MAG: trypsin-like peptidase domain-containing protein [Anaerolineae bacterium]
MASVLQDFSDALALTVEGTGPAVVRVEARRRLPATGIVWSAAGVIVTAHHVVEQDDHVGIGLHDGSTLSARLLGRDPTTDVAVLQAQIGQGQLPLTVPTWADPADLRVGHLALALGRPGQRVLATFGIISALGEGWRTPAGGEVDHYLQSDVVMLPGFSGGPLVDAAGHIIGMNTSAMLRGVSLTIPAPTLRRVVETILSHGHVRRGYLGVSAQAARLPALLAQQLQQESGLLLGSVEADGPADKAGLFMGDTLISLDNQPVRHLDDLMALLTGERVGRPLSARIVRGGQVQTLDVVIGERSA